MILSFRAQPRNPRRRRGSPHRKGGSGIVHGRARMKCMWLAHRAGIVSRTATGDRYGRLSGGCFPTEPVVRMPALRLGRAAEVGRLLPDAYWLNPTRIRHWNRFLPRAALRGNSACRDRQIRSRANIAHAGSVGCRVRHWRLNRAM